MEFLSSFLRRHFAEKPVVASRDVGCFLRLAYSQPFQSRFNCNLRFSQKQRSFESGYHPLKALANLVTLSTYTCITNSNTHQHCKQYSKNRLGLLESHNLAEQYFNSHVATNKMWWNLIKIRSHAIFKILQPPLPS